MDNRVYRNGLSVMVKELGVALVFPERIG